MRLLMMHYTDARWESGAVPAADMIADMGKLIGDMAQAGVMLGAVGLRPSSTGARLDFSGGRRGVRSGPHAASGKLIAGLAIVQVPSLDDAVQWGSRLAAVLGDGGIDIRPISEPWDLGVCGKPAGLELTRFMLTYHADAGAAPAAARGDAMATLVGEMTRAGVFVSAEALQSSDTGLRLAFHSGRRSVTDGPYTEAKELIGGYCMVQVGTMEEAVTWSSRFAGVVGDVVVDIRRLYGHPSRTQPSAAA